MQNIINFVYKLFAQHYILVSLLITLIYTIGHIFCFLAQYGELFYIDSDAYMRVNRIIDWLDDFSWPEKIYPYSNWPFGEVLHFTRAMDVIWVALSSPFMPFLSNKEALFYGGFFFSPLFLFGTLATVFWALKPLFKPTFPNNIIIICLLICIAYALKLESIFDFNRPDHHSLTIFIFVFNISVIFRGCQQLSAKYYTAAGLLTALAVWSASATEILILLFLTISCLCLNWIFHNFPIQKIIRYCIGLFVGTLIAYLLDPPYGGYLVFDNFRLSLIHVSLFFLMLLSFYILEKINCSTKSAKFIGLLACASCSGLLMLLFWGANNLFAPVSDPGIKKLFINIVPELRPSYYYLNLITYLLLGFLLASYLFFQSKNTLTTAKYLSLGFYLYFVLAMVASRFNHYTLYLFIFLNCLFIAKILTDGINKHYFKTAGYLLAWLILFHTILPQGINKKIIPAELNNKVVLTHIFLAPQLIYEQQAKVVGTPYHNNVQGIIDNQVMFFSADISRIKKLLTQHRIDYIYMPKDGDATLHTTLQPDEDKTLFYQITNEQNSYKWLEKISKPGDNYFLYRVNTEMF